MCAEQLCTGLFIMEPLLEAGAREKFVKMMHVKRESQVISAILTGFPAKSCVILTNFYPLVFRAKISLNSKTTK
jgi:hypothetical protein